MMKKIYIPGPPDVKMRPRATKKGHVYDPNAQAKEASIQKAILILGPSGPFIGALAVEYLFVFQRPKNHYRTGKNSHTMRDDAPYFCTVQKDLDNMEKFYADSFNSIHYLDDRQIVRHDRSEKRWAMSTEVSHVQMIINALEPEKETMITR